MKKSPRGMTSQSKVLCYNAFVFIFFYIRYFVVKGCDFVLQWNPTSVHRILKDFYTLTKIRIVLMDNDFHELESYPNERFGFCAYIRRDPVFNKKCVACDRRGCQKSAQTKDLYLYQCHAGFLEAVMPICDQTGAMGYVMFGQILPKGDSSEVKETLRKQYPERLHRGIGHEIDDIPIKSMEELKAAATVLQALTTFLLSQQWVAPVKSEFVRKLDSYIEQHMSEHISVEDVCVYLHVGRTQSYAIAARHLGCGLAAYIRQQKLRYANQLLIETNMSVSAIAEATGFADYNHFSKTYKREFGITARQYRNNALKG